MTPINPSDLNRAIENLDIIFGHPGALAVMDDTLAAARRELCWPRETIGRTLIVSRLAREAARLLSVDYATAENVAHQHVTGQHAWTEVVLSVLHNVAAEVQRAERQSTRRAR